jgi:serine/threonine protein kinase
MAADDSGWKAISPYLDQALEMAAEDRRVWLRNLREHDPAAASQVEVALGQHERLARERFLEHSPAVVFTNITAGASIGVYTLVRPIGEGGMGTVWLAERRDGEIQHQAAVKFLAPGGEHARWRDRFLRERQLLASLRHPSIVHVIDAGHTGDGRPYLVMEYVDGQPIDVYAEHLPVAQRLHLFMRVCDGVSHAHQHLIVHRDLKPNNILVDRGGQPKLLDFGIAKLLNESGTATQTVHRLLTPQYASPEQLRGGAETTATDVYSLGAVLYTLATGHAPHEGKKRVAGTRDDVVPPSRMKAGLPADVDFVIRKAMRDEPNDRYRSVDALAADVRALLTSRPVDARAGDRWYRARTFVRRNRLQLTAAALVLLSMTGGLYIANRERLIAQDRFQQVRAIANQFIALDEDLRLVPGTTKARNRIVSESLTYLKSLGRDARGDTDLALEIGNAYLRVARVQGVPFIPNLGRTADAEQTLQQADTFVDAVLAVNPHDRQALLTSAQIAHDRMAVIGLQRRFDESLAQAHRATERLDRLVARGPLTPEEVNGATQIYSNVAITYQNSNRFEEANAYSKRAIAISAGVDAARMRRASALGALAIGLRRVGDLDGALTASQESRHLLEAMTEGDIAFNLTTALWREGDILGEDGAPNVNRSAEAVAAFRRALAIAEDLANKDAADSRSRLRVGLLSREIGNILRHSSPAEALRVYEHGLARLHEVAFSVRTGIEEAALLVDSSYAARAAGNARDAERRIETAFELLRKTEQYPADAVEPDSEPFIAVRALADHYAATGSPERALDLYQQLLASVSNFKPHPDSDLRDAAALAQLWAECARLLRQTGRASEAEPFVIRQQDLWAAWRRTHPDSTFVPPPVSSSAAVFRSSD